MRVLIDTNVLFSALLFPDSNPAKALDLTIKNYDLIISDQNIKEFKEILRRKAPQYLPAAERLFSDIEYELIETNDIVRTKIRDDKDQAILNAAVSYNVDVIVTGDKDFLCLDIDRPNCMTPSQFLQFFKSSDII